jgi:hypothetical protein
MPMFSVFSLQNRLIVLLLACSGLLAGCDDTPPPPETVVTGRVSYQGKPVTGGTIIFQIEGKEHPHMGVIYEDGTYELTYIVPGNATIAIDTGTKKGLPTYVELPRKYTSPSRSGLSYQVVEGPQTHNIDL